MTIDGGTLDEALRAFTAFFAAVAAFYAYRSNSRAREAVDSTKANTTAIAAVHALANSTNTALQVKIDTSNATAAQLASQLATANALLASDRTVAHLSQPKPAT